MAISVGNKDFAWVSRRTSVIWDLAHSSTGTGYRHLSSMDFMEGHGAVSDYLTSVRLAISESGGYYA
jgi:hypothetical protein